MQSISNHPFTLLALKEPEFEVSQNVHATTMAVQVYNETLWVEDGNRSLSMSIYKRIGGSYFFSARGAYGDDLSRDQRMKNHILDAVDELYCAIHYNIERLTRDYAQRRPSYAIDFTFQEELIESRIPKTIGEARSLCAQFIETRHDLPQNIHSHKFEFNGFHASLSFNDYNRTTGETKDIAEVWKGHGKDRARAGKNLSEYNENSYLDLVYTLCQAVEDDDTSQYPDQTALMEFLERMDSFREDYEAPEHPILEQSKEDMQQRAIERALYDFEMFNTTTDFIQLVEQDPRFTPAQISVFKEFEKTKHLTDDLYIKLTE